MMEGRLSCGVDSTKLDYVVNPDWRAARIGGEMPAHRQKGGGAMFPAGRIGKGFAERGRGVVR